MQLKRCIACQGSKERMGAGMIWGPCPDCNGKGYFEEPVDDIDFLINKQSESYKAAKKRLKSKNKDLSDKEAEELLDNALDEERKGRK